MTEISATDSDPPEGSARPAAGDFADDIARVQRIDAVPKLLEVVRKTTGIGFVAIARVTEDRWVTCAVNDAINFGLKPGGELEVETTLCNEVRRDDQLIVFDDAHAEGPYCGHPTPTQYGFRSYIAVPIRLPDGAFFGTLCAIDPRPLPLSRPETVEMLTLFGELVGFHLDGQDKLRASQGALVEERAVADLRDQFIAVLGHDLRNPIAAIKAAASLLARGDERMPRQQVVAGIDEAADRMSGLVADVLDFARGTLGGGIPVELSELDLAQTVERIVVETRLARPDAEIEALLPDALTVHADAGRVGQLLGNLISNAVHHGAPGKPVQVSVTDEGNEVLVSVRNDGPPIPEAARGKLFAPFKRSATGKEGGGLGLGLFIASEIAKGHGGSLRYEPLPDGSRFVFEMPRSEPRS